MHKHHEYPKFLYHKEKEPVVVKDAEEHKALGAGWKDSPAHFQDKKDDGKKVPKPEVEEPVVPEEDPIEPSEEEPALDEEPVEEEPEESEGFFSKAKKGKGKGKK